MPPSGSGSRTHRSVSARDSKPKTRPTSRFIMAPTVPRIAEERKVRRRRQFVEAAWRCVARTGYRDMTVDAVCTEAKLSKGAFYGYFDQKRSLLVALLEDDAAHLGRVLDELERTEPSNIQRLRSYARAVLEWNQRLGRAQLRADLWTALFTEAAIRDAFALTVQRRRERVRGWVETGIRSGEIEEIPANALASMVLALSDGLMLHASLQPSAFRWANVRRALDTLLAGLAGRRASGNL